MAGTLVLPVVPDSLGTVGFLEVVEADIQGSVAVVEEAGTLVTVVREPAVYPDSADIQDFLVREQAGIQGSAEPPGCRGTAGIQGSQEHLGLADFQESLDSRDSLGSLGSAGTQGSVEIQQPILDIQGTRDRQGTRGTRQRAPVHQGFQGSADHCPELQVSLGFPANRDTRVFQVVDILDIQDGLDLADFRDAVDTLGSVDFPVIQDSAASLDIRGFQVRVVADILDSAELERVVFPVTQVDQDSLATPVSAVLVGSVDTVVLVVRVDTVGSRHQAPALRDLAGSVDFPGLPDQQEQELQDIQASVVYQAIADTAAYRVTPDIVLHLRELQGTPGSVVILDIQDLAGFQGSAVTLVFADCRDIAGILRSVDILDLVVLVVEELRFRLAGQILRRRTSAQTRTLRG